MFLVLASLASAGVSVWAFSADNVVLGVAFALAAIAASAMGARAELDNASAPVRFDRTDALVSCASFVGALGLRLHRIREIPWGINNDVAWNGLYALRILSGEEPYTPYTAEAWGKETFFFYLVAAVFRVFGAGPITLVVPSIVAGALTVAVFYLLSRLLFDRRAAIVAAALLATLAWHLTLSRTGYRAILAPLFLALTLLFFFRAVDATTMRARLAWFAATGMALGVGHHSYFSFRVTTPLLGLLVLRELACDRGFLRRCAAGLAVAGAVAALCVLPLALYAVAHPDMFFARTGHLWIGNRLREQGSWAPVWENLRDNLLLFHYHAPVGNFFNLEWPILSRPMGLFVLVGAGALIRVARRRAPFTVISVGVLAHLPALLSAPDATRSLMVTLAVAWTAAAGVEAVARRFWPAKPIAGTMVAAGLAAVLSAAELRFYFHDLGRDPAAQYGYAGIHTAIAHTVADLALGHLTFVSAGNTFTTTEFLWHDLPPGRLRSGGFEAPDQIPPDDLRRALEEFLAEAPPAGLGLAFVIDTQPANEPLLARVRETFPEAVVRAHDDERYGTPAYYSVAVPPAVVAARAGR